MASLKKSARRMPLAVVDRNDTNTDGVLELSVTVGYLASDVKKEEIAHLERLLHDHCEAGLVSVERGDVEQNLHFQMVCRARVKSARAFGILVRKYMNWFGKKCMNPVGKVMCKVLTQRLIHTWKGMIGYCLKDSGATHFEVAMHNITDEEVIAGKTLHSIYGKADLKSRVILTTKNIGERAYVWYKYRECRQLTATFTSTLTDMVNAGMFSPAAQWIVPYGGQGMEQKKMDCYWKCMTDPANCTKSDIAEVFVNTMNNYKIRYIPEDEDLVEPKKESEEYTFEATAPSIETSSIRTIPRSLGVPSVAHGSDRCDRAEFQVPARTITGARRKLFYEPEEGPSNKSQKIADDVILDFIPLKDRASLPTNCFIPTVDAISGTPRKEMSDEDFWEWLAATKAAAKVTSSLNEKYSETLSAVLGAGEGVAKEGVDVHRKEKVPAAEDDSLCGVLQHEGVDLIILSDSDEEEEEVVVDPAKVFEDRGVLEYIPVPSYSPVQEHVLTAHLIHEGVELIILSDSEDEEDDLPVSYIAQSAVASEQSSGLVGAEQKSENSRLGNYVRVEDHIGTVATDSPFRYKENSRN